MLRTVRSPYTGIRLVPGYIAYSGGVPSFTRYKGNFSSVTDVGTGHARFTLRDRGAEIIGLLTTSTTVGHFSNSAGNPTHDQINVKNYDGTTSTADSDVHVVAIVADQRNPVADELYPHGVNAAMTAGEVLALKLNTTTPSFSNNTGHSRDFTLTKDDTGDVTITLRHPFQFPPVVIASTAVLGTTVAVTECTNSTIRIQRVDASDDTTGVDGVVSLLILGQRGTAHQAGHVRRKLKNHRIAPRLIPFSFSESALNFGSEVITEGSISSGSWAGTWKTPFVVEPCVFPVTSVNNSIYAVPTTASTTGLVVKTAAATGSGTGSTGGVDGIAIGWMDDSIVTRF